MTRYFTPDTFGFLRDLAQNNNRQWFHANKARYEASVREPALEFITDYVESLETLSPHFVADSRTVGGSLFRIHRDTRFAKDKTPYKVNTGLHFRHERAKDAHAPGYYVHLEPRGCFVGVGVWSPEPKIAQVIRLHIDEHQDEWLAATRSTRFTENFELGGESLKRPPRGFDADHRLIDDLKRKSFMGAGQLTQTAVIKGDFDQILTKRFRAANNFMRLLCDAVGVKF